MSWENVIVAVIVIAALVLAARALFGKKSKCDGCSCSECPGIHGDTDEIHPQECPSPAEDGVISSTRTSKKI